MTRTVHVLLVDRPADWETGHLLTELATGRFTGEPWRVVTASATTDPVPTMGGLRWLPDVPLTDVAPQGSDLLVLPGGIGWQPGQEEPYVAVAAAFLEAGVPVAAICGAVEALARAGLLDDRPHTAAEPEVLAGYSGSEHYRDQRAVAADGLVTAGPQSPVQFSRATLGLLGLLPAPALEAYEAVFHDGDASAFPALVGAAS